MMNQQKNNEKVCVIGMGYVGLTLALSFSEVGFKVIGIEKRERVTEKLKQGKLHFYEKGLEVVLQRELGKGFDFETKIDRPLADVYIIAVGTPVDDDKKPNYRDLEIVSEAVGAVLEKGNLVVLRSTIPPGTGRGFVLPILEKKSGLKGGEDFFLSVAPERTIEGKAMEELRTLPQIIGGLTKQCSIATAGLFRKLTSKIVIVDRLEAAEMTKLLSNTFRDMTFAFANEAALMCSRFNLDTNKIIEASNFGYSRAEIPVPSPGVGGYCLTKDGYLLIDAMEKKNYTPKTIHVARKVNESMPLFVVSQIEKFFEKHKGSDFKNGKIYILGFAFKGRPDNSDIRYSPTLDVVSHLRNRTERIYGYDAVIKKSVIDNLGVKYADFEIGFQEADCVLIMNNHLSFESLDVVHYLQKAKKPVLFFDPWCLHNPQKIMKIDDTKYSNLGFDNI